jgi:ankyrin repeat protein
MPEPFELHHLVKRGEFQRVCELLQAGASGAAASVNAYDNWGRTPITYAAESPNAGVDLLRLLLEHGASASQECSKDGMQRPVVSLCLGCGDPQKLAALLESGVDIHYQRGEGFDAALIDAVHGRDISADPHLIDLLKLLVACGVSLSGVGKYEESGLRVLSRRGRFDAVRLLLDAGADETELAWTPLIRAVALGSLADMENAIESGGQLEGRDWWSRTAYLVAIQTGDIAKARLLLEGGADANACGRYRKPALFYAIENGHAPMLEWLLESGKDVEDTNELGTTPLMTAVECGNRDAVEILLKAGADVNREKRGLSAFSRVENHGIANRLREKLLKVGIDLDRERPGPTAIKYAENGEIASRLLTAGAGAADLSSRGRRSLLGLDPEPDEALLGVSLSDFQKGLSLRFGVGNPEEMVEPFWEGMIRAGISAARAADLYGRPIYRFRTKEAPIWCAERFGQSFTFLPDGRIVQIGGEHEDSYSQDFCIYNDVFVHEPDGTIHIFGYQESVFPPTDFHTATLAGEHIYIVGSTGYSGTRQYGTTPVHCLNAKSFRIDRLQTLGEAPGWISGHRAVRTSANEIRISGGKILSHDGDRETCASNERSFVLDIERLVWRTWT